MILLYFNNLNSDMHLSGFVLILFTTDFVKLIHNTLIFRYYQAYYNTIKTFNELIQRNSENIVT